MKNMLFLFLLILFFTSCAPAPAPILTTENAVATVDEFYKFINNAQTEDDLIKSWTMFTGNEQCNPRDQCVLSYFQKNWWQWRVVYNLYGCSPTRVVAEETLIFRDSTTASVLPVPRYWEYQLVESDTSLMINDRRLTQAPESDCALMVENQNGPSR